MTFHELIKTNENDLESFMVYFTSEQWDNDTPEYVVDYPDQLPNFREALKSKVLAWYVDTNFTLHVLLY